MVWWMVNTKLVDLAWNDPTVSSLSACCRPGCCCCSISFTLAVLILRPTHSTAGDWEGHGWDQRQYGPMWPILSLAEAQQCQPADILRTVWQTDPPVAWGDSPQQNVWAYVDTFVEKCHFFVTTTPIDTKTNRSPGRGRHASACQISLLYDVSFRSSLETEKINRLNYYIDRFYFWCYFWRLYLYSTW